jgi:hypothetical protein
MTKTCSLSLIGTTIPNTPELKFGKKKVLHGGLQCLHYDLVDMNKLAPKILKVMELQKRPNVKQILNFSEVWKLGCRALFAPLKQILPDLNNFFIFANW